MVTFPHEFVEGMLVFGKAKYCLIGYLSDHHLTSGTLLFAPKEMTWNFLKKKNPTDDKSVQNRHTIQYNYNFYNI